MKYLGEQSDDFDKSTNPKSSRRNSDGEERQWRGDNYRDDSSGDINDNPTVNQKEELSRSDAILTVAAESIKLIIRIVIFTIFSLFLLVFSSCYCYNLDAEIRAKIERQKKIVELYPDTKQKWDAFEQILLLKEKHDYLRTSFPGQIILGEQIEIGPTPKDNSK